MFIRQKTKKFHGKTYAYWELVESYRTAKGPRQRTVAHLGLLDEKNRNGVLNVPTPATALLDKIKTAVLAAACFGGRSGLVFVALL